DDSHLGGLGRSEIRNPFDMAQRLDDERSRPEWSDTMLHTPIRSFMDEAAGQVPSTVGEVAGDAAVKIDHSVRLADIARSPRSTFIRVAVLPRQYRQRCESANPARAPRGGAAGIGKPGCRARWDRHS